MVYIGSDYQVTTLRAFTPICSIKPRKVIFRELPGTITLTQYTELATSSERESRLLLEVTGTALACAAAIIGIVVVLGGAAVSPLSAGTSLIVSGIGYAALGASGAQCINGIARTGTEIFKPEINDRLDSNEWYAKTLVALDAVSLLGVGTSTLTTIRWVKSLKSSTGKSMREVLRGLSRQERAKLTSDLLSLKDPKISKASIRLLQETGKSPKRYSNATIKHSTATQVRDILGALLGLTGSSVSGNAKHIVFAIYEEF